MLHAEWTLQNDPQRLQALADQFLSLKTVTPGQFTSMADLDSRLPAVRAAGASAVRAADGADRRTDRSPRSRRPLPLPAAEARQPVGVAAVGAAAAVRPNTSRRRRVR